MTVSPTNQSKNLATITNGVRNSVTYQNILKPGNSANYNQTGFVYNQVKDPLSGQPVYYNTVGTSLVMTNQTKN